MKKITLPFPEDIIKNFNAGEQILLSGEIYTARDAAHKRLTQLLENNLPLPFELKNQAVYYCGPCPAPPGKIIGSAGPTTSKRMDIYTPALMEAGLRVMIGKGERGEAVTDAICRFGAVYLTAVGGAGAFLARCVRRVDLIAFEDLGTEAVFRLDVCNLPLVAAIDCKGGNIFMR